MKMASLTFCQARQNMKTGRPSITLQKRYSRVKRKRARQLNGRGHDQETSAILLSLSLALPLTRAAALQTPASLDGALEVEKIRVTQPSGGRLALWVAAVNNHSFVAFYGAVDLDLAGVLIQLALSHRRHVSSVKSLHQVFGAAPLINVFCLSASARALG